MRKGASLSLSGGSLSLAGGSALASGEAFKDFVGVFKQIFKDAGSGKKGDKVIMKKTLKDVGKVVGTAEH